MLEKPMMKEMKQTIKMKTFFLFLSTMGYSSIRAVIKPSTVQNWYRRLLRHTAQNLLWSVIKRYGEKSMHHYCIFCSHCQNMKPCISPTYTSDEKTSFTLRVQLQVFFQSLFNQLLKMHKLFIPDCPGPASWAWRKRGWPIEKTLAAGWRLEDKLKMPDLDLKVTDKTKVSKSLCDWHL